MGDLNQPATTPGQGHQPEENEPLRDALARVIDPEVWQARESDQKTVGAKWEFDERRRHSLLAAEAVLAAGWRPPLPDSETEPRVWFPRDQIPWNAAGALTPYRGIIWPGQTVTEDHEHAIEIDLPTPEECEAAVARVRGERSDASGDTP